MKKYPLWIANYLTDKPTIPPPWEAPTFWQFTSAYHGYGEDATATAIDANYWMGSDEEWKEFAGIIEEPPVIVPPTPPTPPAPIIFTAEDKAHLDALWLNFQASHPTTAKPV